VVSGFRRLSSFFCVLSLDVKCFSVCAVMPVSANGLGISLGFTRFLNENK